MSTKAIYCPKCQENFSRGRGPEGQILTCKDCYRQETQSENLGEEINE